MEDKDIKEVEGIDGFDKFYWFARDTGTYGKYLSDQNNDGPVGDWMASHKKVIESLPKVGTCIQAGGALGLYPCLLSNYYSSVHTFEPCSLSYSFLVKNVQYHKLEDKVHPYNLALGKENKKVRMNINSYNNLGMTTVKEDGETDTTMVRLDVVFESLKELNFIWFDLEGYEFEAIQGAENLIKKFNPIIALERPSPECSKYLENLGYNFTLKSKMDIFFRQI